MSPDAISKLALAIISSLLITIPLILSAHSQSAAATSSRQESPVSTITVEGPEEYLSRLLINKFGHLFASSESDADAHAPQQAAGSQEVPATPELSQASHPIDPLTMAQQLQQQQLEMLHTFATGSPLETRNDEPPKANNVEPDSVKKRSYFRVLDHVFSRIDLPQVFRSPKGSPNSYCANFIGCIDDIPGLPAILRRSNISSTFTLYTSFRPKGVRIPYEPLPHHQLGDVNLTALEIASRLQLQQHNQNQFHPHLHQLTLQHPLQQQLHIHQQLLNKARPSVVPSPSTKPQLSLGASVARRTASTNTKAISAKSWNTASILKRVQEYPFDLSALESSGFKSNENTRIIIGGYFAKEDEHWIEDLIDLWRQLEPSANIIKVSWPDANRGLYHSAALNSRVVGRQLSLFLHYLDQMFAIDLSRFHLVGHSLGAHIAGFVGSDNGGRIGRITGLDPAGPIFVDMDETMRLDPNDAHFVDVVHTNAGSITKGALGLSTPSGHVDYYPNGGSTQPGCYSSSIAIMDPVERVACNHRRSYRYFIEILRLTIEQQNGQQSVNNLPTTESTTPNSGLITPDPVAVSFRSRRHRQVNGLSSSSISNSVRPTAFLFEAKDDELDRIIQPDLLCLDSKLLEPHHRSDECELGDLPARRLVEFHSMEVDFPPGKRGLYFLRTRPEAPFFSSRQYGVTLRTANAIRRKISISLRLDKSALPDFELEQIDSSLTLLFVPTDLTKFNLSADLWFMWRYRTFTLLSSQPDELTLSGLELLELESSPTPSVIKYNAPNASLPAFSSNSIRRAGGCQSDWPTLVRNRWYKFEPS